MPPLLFYVFGSPRFVRIVLFRFVCVYVCVFHSVDSAPLRFLSLECRYSLVCFSLLFVAVVSIISSHFFVADVLLCDSR